MTVRRLAAAVISITQSQSELVFAASPAGDPQVRLPDITRAEQLLGWSPEIDIETGLRLTIRLCLDRTTGSPCD